MKSYTPLFSYLGKGEESYPDLLALVIAVIVTIIVAMGVKNSVGLNNVLNVINLAVWIFIMIAGLFYIKGDNWAEGQFLPFGWPGVSPGCTDGHAAPKQCHHLPHTQLCSGICTPLPLPSPNLNPAKPTCTLSRDLQLPPLQPWIQTSSLLQTQRVWQCFVHVSCHLLE